MGVWLAKLAFGSEVRMSGAELLPELVEGMSLGYDCIVPVPASGTARGYNVPQLMALPLTRALGVPLYPEALVLRLRPVRRPCWRQAQKACLQLHLPPLNLKRSPQKISRCRKMNRIFEKIWPKKLDKTP